jgi:hypothetical protein
MTSAAPASHSKSASSRLAAASSGSSKSATNRSGRLPRRINSRRTSARFARPTSISDRSHVLSAQCSESSPGVRVSLRHGATRRSCDPANNTRNAAAQRPDASQTTHFCAADVKVAPSLGWLAFDEFGELLLQLVSVVAGQAQLHQATVQPWACHSQQRSRFALVPAGLRKRPDDCFGFN